MDWIRIANELWDLLKPLLVILFAALGAFLTMKHAQWAEVRKRVAAREELNDAAHDSVATVAHDYVDPAKDPHTPQMFEPEKARALAVAHMERSAPAAVQTLSDSGAETPTILLAKVERAVADRRTEQESQRPPRDRSEETTPREGMPASPHAPPRSVRPR